MRELTPEEAEKLGVSGAVVSGVLPDSPAAETGIHRGDIITKWNGKPVSSPADLGLQVAWSKIGDKVTVTVRRGDKERQFTVTVGQRPERLR